MELEFSLQIFEKYSNINFIKILPVGTELFHAGGQTDRTKLSLFRNFANAPKMSSRKNRKIFKYQDVTI